MKQMKSLLLVLIGILCYVSVSAHNFVVDGIYYNITSTTDKTVEVTYRGSRVGDYETYFDTVIIPESVTYNENRYSVTGIGNNAFYSCNNLVSVTIPNSVTSIGDNAFYFCTNLVSVTIPNSVTSIGDNAFFYCCGLTSVFIPNSVTSIGDAGFWYCSGLTSITIPNSVTNIGTAAFTGCSSLISIVVASDNSKYDSRDNCNAIIESESNTLIAGCQNTTILNSVTSIGPLAFSGCLGLTSITIPSSVVSITEGAFTGCSLTSIVVASDNSKYDSRENCNAIIESESNTLIIGCQNSTIPNSVTSIGVAAFQYCTNLISITIPNSVISIGSYAFSGCSLISVAIPNSVTSIGDYTFSYSGLTSVTIPTNVSSIGEAAFLCCYSLTSVEIPNSVTSIGNYSFYGSENLKSLISYAEVPPICGMDVFCGVNTQECTLQVPEKSISAYQRADQWKQFLNIKEVSPTVIGAVTTDETSVTADVYNVNGMLIKRNSDLNNLKLELPAGIYIIGGKKVYVR